MDYFDTPWNAWCRIGPWGADAASDHQRAENELFRQPLTRAAQLAKLCRYQQAKSWTLDINSICGNIYLMNVREIVTEELRRRKWSQRELCRQSGLLPHRVAEYLAGHRDIYVETLRRILEVLELEIRPIRRHRVRSETKTMFVIFEDIADATGTKIHKDSCSHYFRRKEYASTTRWHGPFATFGEAENVAGSIAREKSHPANLHPSCCWKD